MKRVFPAVALALVAACSRITLEPAHYACSADAECAGGWRCTKNQVCADPAAGGPWACVESGDCTGGWHCGVDLRCYDLVDAGAVSCRRDAGVEDCAAGWTCGLDGRCLDTRILGSNRCNSDDDCFGGSRCSLGACVDLDAGSLRPSVATPAFARDALPFEGARLLGFSTELNVDVVVAGVVGQELRVVEFLPLAYRPEPVVKVALASSPTALVVTRDRRNLKVTLLEGDGGLSVFTIGQGPPELNPVAAPFAVRALRRLPTGIALLGDETFAIGASADQVTVLSPDAGLIRDVTRIGDDYVVATESGVVAGRTDGGWEPTLCGLRGVQFVRERANGGSILVVTSDGGESTVETFQPSASLDGGCEVSLDQRSFRPESAGVPVAVARPTALLATDRLVGLAYEVDAGVSAFVWEVDFKNSFRLASGDNVEGVVALDVYGRVEAELVAGGGLRVLNASGPPSSCATGEECLVFTPLPVPPWNPQVNGRCSARRGEAWCVGLAPFARAARGAPWFGQTDSDFILQQVYLVTVGPLLGQPVASTTFSLPSVPVVSALAPFGSDGGSLLMVAFEDRVTVAELPQVSTAQLRFAVSPLPNGAVTDVLLLPSALVSSGYAEAWVIASGRVFRVYASSRTLWRSSEVIVQSNVGLIRLWRDGARVRGGDSIGTIFELRTGVVLAGALPASEVVRDYGSRCNFDFALTESHRLFQLNAGAGLLGEWKEVATPVPFERLMDDGDVLRAYDLQGRAYWFENLPASCDP